MKVDVLCAGWNESKIMELTDDQYIKWQNNPIVLRIVPIPDETVNESCPECNLKMKNENIETSVSASNG